MASPSDFPNIGLEFPPCDVICEQLTFFYSTEYPQYLAQASALCSGKRHCTSERSVVNKIPKTFWHQKSKQGFPRTAPFHKT
jgi:hypothetical protein